MKISSRLILSGLLAWFAVTISIAAGVPPTDSLAVGTISGSVQYTGVVPPDKKTFTTDGSTIMHNDLVVDPKTKGLRSVMVLLKDAKPQPKVKDAKPVVMDQKDMIFIPRVIAVQHGQPVVFTNSDLCNHSVMTYTKVPANQFNIFTPVDRPFKFVFAPQERPVIIGCSLHAWMRAWVYVVPHPWFDVTGAKGQFTIRNVPPGSYTLGLKHPDTGTEESRRIEVKAGETTKVQVEWKKAGK